MTRIPSGPHPMNATPLHISTVTNRFDAIIGTGGIGSGSFFLLTGNHTLGREESRGGKFLDAQDYCKLHIIFHYTRILAGPNFPVIPIGKVGSDNAGAAVRIEMEKVGMTMDYVKSSPGDQTLFSFCFLYPDGSGGNLTTDESASSKVDASFIESASRVLEKFTRRFITVAVPEVPLAARRKLLELTKKMGGFGVASFVSGEMEEAKNSNIFELVDLLAINLDEAAGISGMHLEQNDPITIVKKTIGEMQSHNRSMKLSITAGKSGSWSWDGYNLYHQPVFNVQAKSSAGAGDAHIAGILAGITVGLSLQQAQILGNLSAAYSVTSQHSIHPHLNKEVLLNLGMKSGIELDPAVIRFLKA